MAIYVMSDIHGRFDRFSKMIKKLNLKENDTVYILGDVIDRGRDGVEILQFIMKDPRFVLFLGNHEKMMLDFYNESKKEEPDFYYEEVWFINGSLPTRVNFDCLSETQKNKILNYLSNCPIFKNDLVINNKKYCLAHASPLFNMESKTYYLHSKEINDEKLYTLFWQRITKDNMHDIKDTCIVGHTITTFYQDIKPNTIFYNADNIHNATFIDLDCGCAKNDVYARLGAIRLDDMEVFYV